MPDVGLGLASAPEGFGLGKQLPGSPAGVSPIEQAQAELGLTPQERMLYERHLENLNGPGKVMHPDGGISTLYQMSFEGPGGKVFNIPTVYGGKILSPEEAYAKANEYGLHFFPSYPDQKTAEERYQKMHGYMERDTQNFIRQQRLGGK